MAKTPTVVADNTETVVKTVKSKTLNPDAVLSSIEDEVETALKSDDPLVISKVQLKLLLSISTNLNKIDWKLWEFYNRLGK